MQTFSNYSFSQISSHGRQHFKLLLSLIVSAVLVVLFVSEANCKTRTDTDPPVSDFAGHWEGTIGTNRDFGIIIDLHHESLEWSGTAYCPRWGERKWDFEKVERTSEKIELSLPESRGKFGIFKLAIEGASLRGVFIWDKSEYPIYLTRNKCEAARALPILQLPGTVREYDEKQITFKSGKFRYSGLMTQPRSKGPHPAVLIIGGRSSRPLDCGVPGPPGSQRYSRLALVYHLSKLGIATLGIEKREICKSIASFDESSVADLADDAIREVEFLELQKEIDSERVGILGISEGGVIASVARSKSTRIDFLILLCSPAAPCDEVLVEQQRMQTELRLRRISRDMIPREEIDRFCSADAMELKKLYSLAKSDINANVVANEFKEWQQLEEKRRIIDGNKDDSRLKSPASRRLPIPVWSTEIVEQETAAACTPRMRSLLRTDPSDILVQVSCPLLAVYGGNDMRVSASQNYSKMQRVLKINGNPLSKVKMLDHLSHSLCAVEKDNLNELMELTVTDSKGNVLDPQLLEVISEWTNRFLEKKRLP